MDLSDIDFEKLATLFLQKPKTASEKLRSAVAKKAQDLVAQNPTRTHLVEKLEGLVEAYNLGKVDVEPFFEALKKLVAEMEDEERRAASESLTEEELAIFDLLTRPEPKLRRPRRRRSKRWRGSCWKNFRLNSWSSSGGRNPRPGQRCIPRSGSSWMNCLRNRIRGRVDAEGRGGLAICLPARART